MEASGRLRGAFLKVAVERVFGLFAVEELLDGQDLEAWVAGSVG